MLGDFMLNRFWKTFGICCFCTAILAAMPEKVMADETRPENRIGAAVVIRVEQSAADVYAEPDEGSEVVGQAATGGTYDVHELVDGQWAKISTEDFEGYLNTAETSATMEEADAEGEEAGETGEAEAAEGTAEETAEETAARESAERREEIVDYAMQFLGNKYVYGGTNPNKGVDCSGFTSYVMKNAGGVQLSHSSRAQSKEGKAISMDEARPGDLFFYGNGSRINHVALYIGDGEIVHASNEINGILISDCTYRKPVKVVNVLGD